MESLLEDCVNRLRDADEKSIEEARRFHIIITRFCGNESNADSSFSPELSCSTLKVISDMMAIGIEHFVKRALDDSRQNMRSANSETERLGGKKTS